MMEEDGVKMMIYKLAHDRDEDGKDMKRRGEAVIRDGGGMLVTGVGSFEGVGRILERAVEPERRQRRAGATVLWRGESGVS